MPDESSSMPAAWQGHALGALRIVVGILFLEHGLSKLLGFPHNPAFDHLDLGSLPGLAGFFELFGGFLVMVGLFTRPAAFVVSGEMAVAYFVAHAPRGFFPVLNGGDAAILFCFAFLYLFFAGPGRWSLDELRTSKRRRSAAETSASLPA